MKEALAVVPDTLTSDEKAQLTDVVALISQVLGGDAVGAYLFGSAVQGGLRPGSDLDVLAVSARPLGNGERERLVRGMLALSARPTDTGRGRPLELTVVHLGAIRPWRYPPQFEMQYGDWWRSEFESGNYEPWPSPINEDVTLLIHMVRLAGIPLVGPPAAEVFEPIPPQDLAWAMLSCIGPLMEGIGPDSRNTILTLARIGFTLSTGAYCRKDEAAVWAIERASKAHRPVIEHAHAIYLGERAEEWGALAEAVRPCAEAMVAAIHELAKPGAP